MSENQPEQDVEAHTVVPMRTDALLSEYFETGTMLPGHVRRDVPAQPADPDGGALG